MGQKTLNFSVSKCFRPQYNTKAICDDTAYQSTRNPCSKLANSFEDWKEDTPKKPAATVEPATANPAPTNQQRFTTEQLLRWRSRLSKAKIAARKQQDLRKEVLLHNAFQRAQTDLKYRQEERQKRWRELKPLFDLENSSFCGRQEAGEDFKMAAADKMAATTDNKMAAVVPTAQQLMTTDMDDMEIERPSTPLPTAGASKRNRCGCSPYAHCLCSRDSSHLSKKFRPSCEEDEELKSLDRFLASLHFDWKRCSDYHVDLMFPN